MNGRELVSIYYAAYNSSPSGCTKDGMKRGGPTKKEAGCAAVWNAAIEAASLAMRPQDCAHGCGIGQEIAEKILRLRVA